MFRKFFLLFCILTACQCVVAQQNTLFSIDGQGVPADDFGRHCSEIIAYGDTSGLYQLMTDYADYRLMVAEAHSRMVDTMEQYRRAKDYYSEQMVLSHVAQSPETKVAVADFMAHSNLQYKVSIIRTDIYSNSAGDSLPALQKARMIRDRINNGRKFEDVARQLSDDPRTKLNGGYLGWVSPIDFWGGREVASYIYSHCSGGSEVSQPIRSGNSYYLIKVSGCRNAVSRIKFSPIVVRKRASWRYNDSIRNLFSQISKQIKEGKKFADLQFQYSDVKFQENLPLSEAYRKYSTHITDLDADAFTGVTGVIETKEMFIICAVDETTPLVVDNQYQSKINDQIPFTDIFRIHYSHFLDSVRLGSDFKMLSNFRPLYKLMPDSAVFESKWEPGSLDYLSEPLFSLGGKSYTLADFAKYIYHNQRVMGYSKIPDYVSLRFHEYVDMLSYGLASTILRRTDKSYTSRLDYYMHDEAYRCLVRRLSEFSGDLDTAQVGNYYRRLAGPQRTSHVLSVQAYDYFNPQNRKKALKIADMLASNPGSPVEPVIAKQIASGTYQMGDDIEIDPIIKGFNDGKYSDKNKVVFMDDVSKFYIVSIVERPRELSDSELYSAGATLYAQSRIDDFRKQLRSKHRLQISPDASQILAQLADKYKKK